MSHHETPEERRAELAAEFAAPQPEPARSEAEIRASIAEATLALQHNIAAIAHKVDVPTRIKLSVQRNIQKGKDLRAERPDLFVTALVTVAAAAGALAFLAAKGIASRFD